MRFDSSSQIKQSHKQETSTNHSLHQGESQMGGEILNAAILSFGLIFVGWALGTLLLKIQGVEE